MTPTRFPDHATKWKPSKKSVVYTLDYQMGEYCVFTVGREAHLVSYRKFTCRDDSEAIVWAKHLLDRFPVELWSGDRLVIRIEPTTSAMPTRI
jgi:hypothetical protein